MSKRNEYEQLEFQRKNPHLYTTPTQSVNHDGTIITYEQVTRKLAETKEKLESMVRRYAKSHDCNPDYWFLMEELQDTRKSVDMIDTDMKRALLSFTENYKHMKERILDHA